jgi:hypothetical protein
MSALISTVLTLPSGKTTASPRTVPVSAIPLAKAGHVGTTRDTSRRLIVASWAGKDDRLQTEPTIASAANQKNRLDKTKTTLILAEDYRSKVSSEWIFRP